VKTASGSLSLLEQIFGQSGQDEERGKEERAGTGPLNIIGQAFGQSDQNKRDGQISQPIGKTIKNKSRPLNLIREAFDS
jgi:hypothetical protein